MKDLASLLASARAGLSPTVEQTARVREKLLTSVAAPAPAAPLAKLGLLGGGLIVVVVVVGAVLATRPSHGMSPQLAALPPPVPDVAAVPEIEPVAAPEPPPARSDPEPVEGRDAAESKGGTTPRKRPAPPPPAPSPTDDALARELRHLSAARAALRDDDKVAARAALEEYDLEFDDKGQLAAEAAKLAKEASDAP